MPRHIFPGDLHLLPSGGPAVNTAFTVWTERVSGALITDMLAADGVSAASLTTDNNGLRAALYGPNNVEVIYVDTGAAIRFPVYADDSLRATLDETFLTALTNRVATLESGGGVSTGGGGSLSTYGQVSSLSDYPATFPPSTHSHPSGQISDSTTVGRAVITALDAQAARVAIGAGTGSGTSNLTIGTTSTTAAAGNHAHAASAVSFTPTGSITAQDVQAAIVQAANTGGTSSTSQVLVWRYSAGGWPALPTTKPTGVYEVRALGPSYPATVPTWVGLTAAQIPMSYSKVAVQ